MRKRTGVAPKVEVGSTLYGNVVTGTHVDPTHKVTGSEAGSCRAITGTGYTGAEQYAELCDISPRPNAAKVGLTSTGRGQRVTGTEVGRSNKVTGDEHGSCMRVTGTEYLSAENLEGVCDTSPEPAPAKVNVSETRGGRPVSGTAVGPGFSVTGDEAGACSDLTGTQYVPGSLPPSLCTARAPRKVNVMTTVQEQLVTGTDVGHSAKMTGNDYGACVPVSGTGYVGLEQYQACNRAPVPTPHKVSVMRTWKGQQVSGTTVESSDMVTGDEHGECQPVSGDPYVGPDQYGRYCDTDAQAAAEARAPVDDPAPPPAPSGTRVVPGGNVTGSERGQAVAVSGTPYASAVRAQAAKLQGRLQAQPALRQAPAEEERQPTGHFSVTPPASVARDSTVTQITGTAYGGGPRITGPVDRADGLVSGTPEFRHAGEVSSASQYLPPAEEAGTTPRNRITGEGRESGFTVTGASAWRRNESVTGTEGASTRRNPTLRGDPRGVAHSAVQYKDLERPELPPSKVTGSSGNYPRGSLITYSGGARG